MANSTAAGIARKQHVTPQPKPVKFYKHRSGQWAKKVNGQTKYFGKVADDPNGVAALESWLAEKDDLLAGRLPRSRSEDAIKLGDLCNDFLAAKRALRDQEELQSRSFALYWSTCKSLCETFGRNRTVSDLQPEDFRELSTALAKRLGKVAQRNETIRIRSVFKFALVEGLIKAPIIYGSALALPKARFIRRERKKHRQAFGKRMFEAEQIRAMLDSASQPLRTMILLAINCGFGQTDLSELPLSAVDLQTGWADYPRPKTEVDRRCKLWPETVQAIAEWLPVRPTAADKADAQALFLTRRGTRWVRVSAEEPASEGRAERPGGQPSDGIGQEFTKLLRRLNLKKDGDRLSFYALRHTFETVAGGSRDQVAVGAVMGHVDGSMAAAYREEIDDSRLQAVAEHVHRWLFGATEGGEQ